MKNRCIYASEKARDEFRAMQAECVDIDSFVRTTGETLARYDHVWKQARAGGGDVGTAVADFVLAGMAHLDALEMADLRDAAVGTMITMLVSVDMSGVSRVGLGVAYLDLHLRFARACVELCSRMAGDGFASAHAGAVLRLELPLYAGVYEAFVAEYKPEGDWLDVYTGMYDAARSYVGVRGEDERIVANPDYPAEALVDMMSRLGAIL